RHPRDLSILPRSTRSRLVSPNQAAVVGRFSDHSAASAAARRRSAVAGQPASGFGVRSSSRFVSGYPKRRGSLVSYGGRQARATLGGSRADEKVYHLRERLWEANKRAGTEPTTFVEKYGCSELGMAAAECERNDGMHLYQGFIYTEILEERTWRPVRNGERGLV